MFVRHVVNGDVDELSRLLAADLSCHRVGLGGATRENAPASFSPRSRTISTPSTPALHLGSRRVSLSPVAKLLFAPVPDWPGQESPRPEPPHYALTPPLGSVSQGKTIEYLCLLAQTQRGLDRSCGRGGWGGGRLTAAPVGCGRAHCPTVRALLDGVSMPGRRNTRAQPPPSRRSNHRAGGSGPSTPASSRRASSNFCWTRATRPIKDGSKESA